MSEAELAKLAAAAADLRLGPGEYAAHEGDPRALFVVLDGHIEVVKAIDGIERRIGARKPGQIFGEARRHESGGVFVFIGADAETSWLPNEVARDDRVYVLTGDAVVRAKRWSEQRDPTSSRRIPRYVSSSALRHP